MAQPARGRPVVEEQGRVVDAEGGAVSSSWRNASSSRRVLRSVKYPTRSWLTAPVPNTCVSPTLATCPRLLRRSVNGETSVEGSGNESRLGKSP
jgi:hypothetical protein